jgi:hypothetical protein
METPGASLQSQQVIFLAGDQVNRDMPVIQIIPEQVKYFPSTGVRQFHVKRNGDRREAVDKVKDLNIGCGNNRF